MITFTLPFRSIINFKKKKYIKLKAEIEMKSYKICKCCKKEFSTEDVFLSNTKLVGIQSFAPYNLLSLELRDCSCGTTLARRIPILETSLKQALVAAA